MEVNNTAQSQQAYKATEKEIDNTVDKEFFLELLVTQMKYQDPLSPKGNDEFIAQTAQFSLLEEMQTLKSEFQQNKALNLIGKYVEGKTKNPLTGNMEIKGGIVDSVTISEGKPSLNIGDLKMKPDNITGVKSG